MWAEQRRRGVRGEGYEGNGGEGEVESEEEEEEEGGVHGVAMEDGRREEKGEEMEE